MGTVTTHTEGHVVTHSDEGLPVEVVQMPARDAAAQAAAPPVAPAAAPPAPSVPAKPAPAAAARPTPAVKSATKQKAERTRKGTKRR